MKTTKNNVTETENVKNETAAEEQGEPLFCGKPVRDTAVSPIEAVSEASRGIFEALRQRLQNRKKQD